ncbi:cell envelope integrity protein TolA [Gammaproteobacteria bacterium]|nr:cell envelope integrity protein TolA [Gammaproteobacteria bacterium]
MPSLRELLGFGKSEGANNLVILNGYPLAVVVAISLHILLLGGLVYLQSSSQSQALELIQPTVIKALLIEENPQITNQRNQDNRRLEAKRKETERANAAAQKKREEQAAERKRQEEAAQVAKQRADAKAKAEREKTLAEEERKKREAESQREAEKRREEQAQRERESRQQREREDAAAAEAASSEFELIQSATGLIQQLVTENWSRPPSARNGMRAIIQIKMLPTGELVDVIITQSSGDPAFDRSAENAVYRAAPFAELTALPIRVFNQNFRTLSLIFQPEDLLN